LLAQAPDNLVHALPDGPHEDRGPVALAEAAGQARALEHGAACEGHGAFSGLFGPAGGEEDFRLDNAAGAVYVPVDLSAETAGKRPPAGRAEEPAHFPLVDDGPDVLDDIRSGPAFVKKSVLRGLRAGFVFENNLFSLILSCL
jgi:hypothetical protein